MRSIIVAIVMLAAIFGMVVFAEGLVHGALQAVIAEIVLLAVYIACSYYLEGHKEELLSEIDDFLGPEK